MTDASNFPGTPAPPTARRLIGIVVLFALLGPVVGAVSVSAVFTIVSMAMDMTSGSLAEAGGLLVSGLLIGTAFGLPVAFLLGSIPAALVGFAVGLWERRKNLVSYRIAIAVALVVWVVFFVSTVPSTGFPHGLQVWLSGLLAANIAGALVCSRIARAVFKPR